MATGPGRRALSRPGLETADLIITNGDAADELLRRTLPGVEILPWRDVLHEGPVPLTATLPELTEIRAAYLAERGWGDRPQLKADLEARDKGLALAASFERVILWFEHDLYDQLQLLQLLDWFSTQRRRADSLLLVQAPDFLGQQMPEGILEFKELERPVTPEEFALASEAWRAFRSSAPEPWHGLLGRDLSALPFLYASVTRMLEELPGLDGLSGSERQILAAIEAGAVMPPSLFVATQREEEAPFMGDWSFWGVLDGLALAKAPLVTGLVDAPFTPDGEGLAQPYFRSELRLTPLGFEILAGRDDFARHAAIHRWCGGTHLSNVNLWRWDAVTRQLIPPTPGAAMS